MSLLFWNVFLLYDKGCIKGTKYATFKYVFQFVQDRLMYIWIVVFFQLRIFIGK